MLDDLFRLLEKLNPGRPAALNRQFYISKKIFDFQDLVLDVSTMSSESKAVSTRDRLRLTKEWETLIPYLTGLRSIETSHKVSQSFFEAICKCDNLESVKIKWSGITSIEPLRSLKKLRCLEIDGAPQVHDIEVLRELPGLTTLSIKNFKSPLNLTAIQSLNGLVDLTVSGGLDKTLRVESLAPLQGLSRVRRLMLQNLRVIDKDLRVIAKMQSIEELGLAMWWPAEDFTFLEANLPNLMWASWKGAIG